jgi:phage baseplate assembly protein W
VADVPHFTIPLRFERGAALVCEQDDGDEIVSCAVSILVCPLGFRVELPTYGVPDPTFTMPHSDVDVITDAVIRWEPRADLLVTQHPDALDVLVDRVRVAIGTPAGG